MSMLSSQVDELRAIAGDGSTEWVAGPIRASALRRAADTIWELRDKCSDLMDERDRLARRTARRVTRCDGATGSCRCSGCHGAIDQDDAWCRHCGPRLEDE